MRGVKGRLPGSKRRSDPAAVAAAIARVLHAVDEPGTKPPSAADLRLLTRALLDQLADVAPGRSVEVRVPPYAAVQCVAGPRHTRGTPGGVVETDPLTWVRLATGRLAWADAVVAGLVRASGERADLAPYLPL